MWGVAQTPFHAYDHIELPEIKPDVTRVTLHRGFCPCCGRPFRAEAPAGLEPGSPFGPNLRAFAIYLRFVHAISFERLARLMSDLVGLAISEGALVAMLADSRRAFARQASLIRARLLAGSVLQSDETSVRLGKKNWWLWTFHHGQDCCFVIRPSRGKDVVAEFLGDVSSRPARCQGRRVEWLSRTAGTLAVQLAATFPGRSLTGASTPACSCAPGSRAVAAYWRSNAMGDR